MDFLNHMREMRKRIKFQNSIFLVVAWWRAWSGGGHGHDSEAAVNILLNRGVLKTEQSFESPEDTLL